MIVAALVVVVVFLAFGFGFTVGRDYGRLARYRGEK